MYFIHVEQQCVAQKVQCARAYFVMTSTVEAVSDVMLERIVAHPSSDVRPWPEATKCRPWP